MSLRTTINPVEIRASCENTGIIQFVLEPDHFPDASVEDPIYIRLELDKEAKIGTTLVWSHPGNPDALTTMPIFLPISIDGVTGGLSVSAPPESVSIVRWKKGESAIWLKIQTSASTWFGIPDPPDVKWTIGIAARTTWEQNSGSGNIPAASRNPDITQQSEAVSTLICVDLQDSFLLPAPAPDRFSLLDFRSNMFDGSTMGVETAENAEEIVYGAEFDGAIFGDMEIARGYEIFCDFGMPPGMTDYTAELCPQPAKGDASGLVQLQSDIHSMSFDCGSAGWGIHQDSTFYLRVDEGADYGFRVLLDKSGQPIFSQDDPGKVMLHPDALKFLGVPHGPPLGSASLLFQVPSGEFLCGDVGVGYRGESTLGEVRLQYQASVWGRVGGPSQPVVLSTSFFPKDKDFEDFQDLPPFDGLDQFRRCHPSFYLVDLGNWAFGEFVACSFCECESDFDCDYVIGESDLMLIYNQMFTPGPVGDLNGDGGVDVADALLLMNQYGSCLD